MQTSTASLEVSEVSCGSKCEILRASRCFPVRQRTRKFFGAIGTSHLCHEESLAANLTAYSITSSAVMSSVVGIVRPRAFAVLRLTVNLRIVGCSTGKSAGFAPFNILST
jgi:hypothetical protein